MRPLKYATLDSKRFARAMELMAQIPNGQILVSNNPSIQEFRAKLQETSKGVAADPSVKRFIFFFSGHSDERGFHFRDGLLPKEEVHAFLRQMPTAIKISNLDSCFSGALAAKGIEPAVEEFLIPQTDFDEPTGTVFLTASSADEAAFENSRIEGSVFSNHLLAGLYGGGDSNQDGLVTVEELYQFIYQKTRYENMALPTGLQQKPEFVSRLQGRGALVMSTPKATLQTLNVDPKIIGEIRLTATYGLRSFVISNEARSAKKIQVPPPNLWVQIPRSRLS